ncbi:MAG: 2-oxo acid dehydrogenase subunit E2 [Verrucomicrobia bacterium]|nr:2-oxo acid dehydrogenase subunit E2 [Verrucomicrobiota bacterium]
MTSEYKVTLPKLGESIVSASIVQWFKKEGDTVALDEPLLEVSTDKVNSEIPSPVAGTLGKILATVGQELQVGDAMAVIHVHAEAVHLAPTPVAAVAMPTCETAKEVLSPALLRLAREAGVGMEELQKIPTSGAGGRLTKRDLEIYLSQRGPAPAASSSEVERVKMSGMRKAIADNMVKSFYEAPHASLVTEVDVTEVMKLIAREKEAFLSRHNAKLTITSFVARAIAKALREYPLLNSSLEGDTIVIKRFVNLGIAVSVDQGIMVPVIKNCQSLDMPSLAHALNDLSLRARTGKLQPEEVKEGTITLTNFGISGVQIGIPIIRYPEVAIVGIGAIHKRVVAVEDDLFGVRSMMHVSLTFDHRVLDGMYGCGFLNAVKTHLENDINI